MRHDSHFVEEITSTRSESIGRLIDIDRIEPNPHQPRKNFGDLSDMVASIKEKGVLEPILVRAVEGGRFEIIAGERRYQASKIAGLRHVPVHRGRCRQPRMLEISLIENLQRKDLTPFEEAGRHSAALRPVRYTHEEIARKLGKSRTVITEALSLNRMPEPFRSDVGRPTLRVSRCCSRSCVKIPKKRCINSSTGSPATGSPAEQAQALQQGRVQ